MAEVARISSSTLCDDAPPTDDWRSCMICCGSLTESVILHCGHAFCADCLHMYYTCYRRVQPDGEGITVSCPTCLENTQIPAEGMQALQDPQSSETLALLKKMSMVGDETIKCEVCIFNEKVNECEYYCSKCQLHLCKSCKTLHNQQNIFRDHQIIHISTKEVLSVYCVRHNNSHATYFCILCNLPICTICIFHEHNSHQLTKLREALLNHRDTLRTLLNSLQQRIHQTEILMEKIDNWLRKHLSKIIPNFAEHLGNVPSGSQGSPAITRKTIAESSNDENAPLLRRRSYQQGILTSLKVPQRKRSIIPFKLLRASPPQDGRRRSSVDYDPSGLNRKGSVSRYNHSRSRSLCETERLLGPSNEEEETKGENGRKNSDDSGYRKSSNESNGSDHQSSMSTIDSVMPHIEQEMGIDVMAMNFHLDTIKKLFEFSMKATEISQTRALLVMFDEITSRIDVILNTDIPQVYTELHGIIRREAGSVMTLAAQRENSSSTDTGIYDKNESPSQSINDTGSMVDFPDMDDVDEQFCMLVKPELLWKFEKHKNDQGDLWNPSSIEFLQTGEVIVAEYDSTNNKNNRLRIFDHEGMQINAIAEGKMKPLGMAITREGNIAVTDCMGKRVKVYSPEGQQVAEWGKGMFGWPYGIATNSRGQFIVTDAFNDIISIHQPDGRKIKHFGGSGRHRRQFKNPYHLATDKNDNIIVSDCGNHCIKLFDVSGEFICKSSRSNRQVESVFDTISKSAAGRRFANNKSSLKSPRGLCVDLKGNILVADDRGRVSMFNSQAHFERNILTGEDSVNYADDLAVDDRGKLAVTEWNPNNMFAIKVFGLYE